MRKEGFILPGIAIVVAAVAIVVGGVGYFVTGDNDVVAPMPSPGDAAPPPPVINSLEMLPLATTTLGIQTKSIAPPPSEAAPLAVLALSLEDIKSKSTSTGDFIENLTAFGELAGDAGKDAAVIFKEKDGYRLEVYGNEKGVPSLIDTYDIESGATPRSLSVTSGKIKLVVRSIGANDIKIGKALTLILKEGKLQKIDEEVASVEGEFAVVFKPREIKIDFEGRNIKAIRSEDLPDGSADHLFAPINAKKEVLIDGNRGRIYFLVYNSPDVTSKDFRPALFAYDAPKDSIKAVIAGDSSLIIDEKYISPNFAHILIPVSAEYTKQADAKCNGLIDGGFAIHNLVRGTLAMEVKVHSPEDVKKIGLTKLKGWKGNDQYGYETFEGGPTWGYRSTLAQDAKCVMKEAKTVSL